MNCHFFDYSPITRELAVTRFPYYGNLSTFNIDIRSSLTVTELVGLNEMGQSLAVQAVIVKAIIVIFRFTTFSE